MSFWHESVTALNPYEAMREEEERMKLKPCPFCGGEAELAENEYEMFDVSCKNLDCRGFACCLNYKNAKEAIAAWNLRNGK